MKTAVIIAAACALFWIGRSGSPPDPATPRREASAAPQTWAEITARLVRIARPVPFELGADLVAARARASSPTAQAVRATIHESPAQREARHRYLASEADRLKPDLAPAKLDQLLAVADHNEERFRAARAKFMLGEIDEDDYIAALEQQVRDGVEATKAFLSHDEFAALEGNPDYDPFDPDAPAVEGQAPYLSRVEEAALETDPGHASAER